MPEDHAPIGGSTARRTLACPAWLRLSRDLPKPPSSAAADEGTALHNAAATLLTGLGEAAAMAVLRAAGPDLIPDPEDVFARVLAPAVRTAELLIADREFMLETWADFPDVPDAGGTVDLAIFDTAGKLAAVVDFKFGRHRVSAVNNHQLVFYATALAARYGIGKGGVGLHIIQPRGDMHSSDRATAKDLEAFAADIRNAAAQAEAAEPAAGAHCRFCPARPVCPAMVARIAAAVRIEPAPHATELGRALALAREAREWADEVERLARRELSEGRPVVGWKMVKQHDGNRVWADDAKAEAAMAAQGLDPFEPRKLLSVPKAEKLGLDIEGLTRRAGPVYAVVTADDRRPEDRPGAEFGKGLKLGAK